GAAQALDAPAGRRTPAPAQGRRAHQNADARVHSLKSQRVSLPQRQGGGPVRTAGLHCLKPEIYLFGGLGKKPQHAVEFANLMCPSLVPPIDGFFASLGFCTILGAPTDGFVRLEAVP